MNIARKLLENRRIEGERIILRPVTFADAEEMYAYASHPDTTKYIFPPHEDLERTIDGIADYFMAEPLGKYGIELRENGAFIGTIDFRVKEKSRSAEIGYVLHQDHTGHGYATEAGKLLLRLGFEILGLERIYGLHDTRNKASERVLQRLGMTHEGILRKNRFEKDTFVDDSYYSILKEEYEI